ncbi:hemagglutinin repeat-containing protein [Yersinia frederiksenii]|uniref:hemagglutinin repeat-containing protein n=3 Tax=Yersinia TaxID=629 RepID=UPI0005E8827B|nr:hemagglutinin repeat-containing protein [Yersinia frederiksenii]CNE86259.1 hemagglutinin/adhesin repeat-containing protein [Yersinia frederiksenii]
MNKNLYRIVFNKARGMLMVVADIAASGQAASSASSGVGHTQSRRISALSPLSFSLLLAFGCVSLSAQANIVADGSAPANQQPTIINSANGTPQVNIQTPSSGGVSRNVYNQFDVDNRGVILNNGHGPNQTQIAGVVDGNPWLARGEASIILNEVNSRDPSKLNGYIEVAGRKAQVVIANPSGITCEGCGFINANRATLTTGQAQLTNGQLTGYDVERGEIVIQGNGLDSSRQDHTDLIARSVKVNAGIWAKELNVTTGRNQVDAAHQSINAKASDGSPRPTVAVDVANLGGMYAGKIRLIGTETGVGVRNAGEIGASAGDITITADGMLMNSGQINSAQHLVVKTGAEIENTGVLYASANNQLTTAGKLTNSGTIAAAGDTSLRAAEVNSSRNSVLGAGVKSDNSSITSGTLKVEASGKLIAQGKNISGTAQSFNAHSIDLSGSQTQSRDVALTAQSGDINLTGAEVLASQSLSASTTSVLYTNNARLIADKITFNAQTLSNVGGVIAQTGTTDFNLNLPGYIDNRDGTLLSTGTLSLQAEGVNSNSNSLLGAGIQSDGRLTESGNLLVNTRQELIAQGQTLAADTMILTGSRIDLSDSYTQAREMNITATQGDISTQRANILALGALTINASANAGQTLNNQGGALAANSIHLKLSQLNNNAGKVTASEDLTINLQSDFNHLAGSTLQAGRDFTLTTAGDVTNSGQMLAGGKLSTNSSNLLNSGTIIAKQADLKAAGALINSREILATGSLNTDANTLFNTGTLIGAEATLKARERITNSGPNALIGATDENGTLALLAPVIENSDTVTDTDTAPTTTILGMGKVILAGGQDSGGNYQLAAQVLNLSGLIESGQDMLIYATTLTNSRHILTANSDFVVADTVNGSAYWTVENPDIPGGRYSEPPHEGADNSDYIGTDYTSTIAYNSIDNISPEAQLLAGRNLTPQVGTLENFWSKISAQGEINLTGVTLQQDGWGSAQRLMEQTTSSGQWNYRNYKGGLWHRDWGPEVSARATNQYASSLTAQTVSGSGTTINNGANPGAIAPPNGNNNSGKDLAIEFNGISLTPPNGGLYQFSTDYTVNSQYLIETNPAFANLNSWRGSDYVLQQLNNDPNVIFKRLGDNAYEQRLVRDQVLALTGQTVASDYRSAQEQFEELFAAGLEYSEAFNIALGTHLSAEQMATLTTNIVLMESREVAGQTVLVPVVYLAGVKPGDLQANGALISAENIALTEVQGFTNQGAINATNDLQISMAQDITLNNRGGLLQAGGNMLLSTLNSDIDLTGSRLTATNLQLDSGRDIILRTDSAQLSSDNGAVQRSQTVLGPLASINVSNNAVINTERDFIMQGAGLNVGQDLQVNTGGDWLLNTVQTRDQITANYGRSSSTSEHIRHLGSEVNVGGALTANVNNLAAVGATINAGSIDVQADNINLSAATDSLNVTGESSSKRSRSSVDLYDETLLGSQLNATGDINLNTAHDINIIASAVQTSGALTLAAGGNVNLTTQTEQHDAQRTHTGTSKGLASSTTTRTEDSISQTLAVGSMLSAGSIDVSGKNIAVIGSNVVADNDINLRAQENIIIGTAQQSESESHLREEKKSGLMSTGGIGVTVGSNSTKVTDTGQSTSNVGSTVGSLLGNVNMTAGEDLTVKGSEVLAGKDINLTGKNVSILAAENQSSQTHTVEQKSSGLTLALSGTVGSALNTAVTTAKAASEESNGRLAALQGVKAALSGVQAVQGGQLATLDARDQNAIGVSLSYGSQSSKSEQTVNQTTHQGSTLTAGNNLNITATGNGVKGQDGDIVVQGSQLQAGKDASLTANRDVILQSTQESQTLDGSNSSSGGSLGVGIGAGQGGWGINVSASLNKGKGSESGNGVSYTETTVNAGNQLNITSGRDTVLQGAQVSGETVKADVGRDLLLQSQQDSDRYDSKQQDASVGGSFNFGSMTGSASINASQDKMHSNFDSVQEQTGIFAGKGGFDITVGEHTQLDGAVIGSTATADKNTLDTGTLGFSDIENKADFKVEHQSVGISTGGNIGGQFTGNMANGLLTGVNNEGHADSITHAAVSDGTITIRDTEKQQQNVDDLSRDVEHANNALSPIFDKEKEQNRLREAQLIGEIGSQVSDVIRTQGKIIATKAANEKMLDVSEKDKVDAKAQWEKANPGKVATAEDINGQVYKTAYDQAFNESGYGTGGKFQQAAQAATAAIQGLAGGDMAKALAGASAPYLAEVIHNMTTDPVTGKVNTEANLMAHAVLGAVMAQVNGNNALSGASGALMGEFIAQQLYPDIPRNELSEEQKQTISALGTLAAGLAGGLTGDSTADAVAGAQAGKNALENNNLAILRTGAAACAEIAVCSKAVIDLGFGALIGVGVATSAIEELSGVQKTNVMLAAMSGDQEQIDKLSPSERAAYEELKNSKGLITVFPTPVDDPTGGKLINPAPDQNKGTALVTPDKSGENGATNTGNMDGNPDMGGNVLVSPGADPLTKKDIVYLSENPNSKIDTVINETLSGKKNFTSSTTLTSDEALAAGLKFLGTGYKEIGKSGSGVYHSADGTKEFRIDSGSIDGAHAPGVPHVHFGVKNPETGKYISNNHVPYKD